MAKAIVFSGPPGVGKSTLSYMLAQKIGGALITKDSIDRSLEKENIINGRAGYEVLLGLSKLNLQNNVSVILDAVFTVDSLRETITAIAQETNAQIYFIVCTCSDEEVWKKRISDRPEMVEGWTPADWGEVQRVRERYVTWKTPHLLLDSVNSLDENFQKLLFYLE
jgi:predicted kinase